MQLVTLKYKLIPNGAHSKGFPNWDFLFNTRLFFGATENEVIYIYCRTKDRMAWTMSDGLNDIDGFGRYRKVGKVCQTRLKFWTSVTTKVEYRQYFNW